MFQVLKGSYEEDGETLHKEPHEEDKKHKVQIAWDRGLILI